ncbi:MAG: endonuclease/exonuclease/phosphatase family protein, partial [Planctomycetes bacterium]|nr:endonuclease/exonuclease/phosphatase family protein [Planctomycetota bacterium]
EQANALKKLQTGESPPILIAGDLNAVPDSATIKTLSETWVPTTNASMFTFPSKEPKRQLDYVLVPKGWRLVEARVIDESIASDHRPLLVIVEKELANLPVP